MKIYPHFNQYPSRQWLWPNFSPREMACRGDNNLAIDNASMDKLQALRDLLGRPLIINSAYRSPSYNAKIGGVKASQHLKAKAYDISMANQEPTAFLAAARAVGFTGFGFYRRNNFIHIDTGRPRTWGKRWFSDEAKALPVEKPLEAEHASEDRSLIGSVVGGGGAMAGAGATLSGLSSLSPIAQVVAVAGLILAIGAALYIFRDRLGKLRR